MKYYAIKLKSAKLPWEMICTYASKIQELSKMNILHGNLRG